MNKLLSYLLLALLATFSTIGSGLAFLTELRERGYSLIPAPQQVKLSEGDIVVDESWGIETGPEGRFSAGWIRNWSDKLHGLSFEGTGNGRIVGHHDIYCCIPGYLEIGVSLVFHIGRHIGDLLAHGAHPQFLYRARGKRKGISAQ